MFRFVLSSNRGRLGTAVVIVSALALLGTPLFAQDCKTVEGHINEHFVNAFTVTGPTVGFLSGTYTLTLLGQTTTPNPAVTQFTGSSTISTKKGDLNLDEAGSVDFQTGNLSVLWTVKSGTGKYAKATGQFFATGNFDVAANTGLTHFRGEVCTP